MIPDFLIHSAVYESDDLLAVTVYKRGAQAMLARLQTLDQQLAEQQARLATLSPAGETALPRAAEAALPPRFQERVSRPTEQLALFSPPDRAACRRRDRSKGLGSEYGQLLPEGVSRKKGGYLPTGQTEITHHGS